MLTDMIRNKSVQAAIVLAGLILGTASAQTYGQRRRLPNLIVKVENGVDQFRDYLKRTRR